MNGPPPIQFEPISTEENWVLREIGLTLCQLQAGEEVIMVCLAAMETSASGGRLPVADAMDCLDRATLGEMVERLRQVVVIEPVFARTLKRFVKARNLFVHGRFFHADHNPGHSQASRERALRFIHEMRADFLVVKGVFTRLLVEAVLHNDAEMGAQAPSWRALLDQTYGKELHPFRLRSQGKSRHWRR